MSRAVVILSLSLAAALATNACLRVVDLTPVQRNIDAGSNAPFEDGQPGGSGDDGGAVHDVVDHDADIDHDGGGLDAGVGGLDA
ncbi:MAG TPA: hypothetical protein VGG74_32190 [Kofleriaceae bacterium]